MTQTAQNQALFDYTLRLGDNALIMASAWPNGAAMHRN